MGNCDLAYFPAPTITSALFLNTLMAVALTFAHPIAFGPSVTATSGTYQLCQQLFDQNSLDLMQVPAPAVPTTYAYSTLDASATVLTFYPGSGASLLPNSTTQRLSLLPNVIYRPGSGFAANAAYVPTLLRVPLGASPLYPTAVTSLPLSISFCSPLPVDGTGSVGGVGRALTYSWTIDGSPVSTLPSFTYGAGLLTLGAHTVALTVGNAFGLTHTRGATVTVLAAAVPTLTVSAPAQTTPTADVLITPIIALPPCSIAINPSYRFVWSQVSGPSVFGACCASQKNARDLLIRAGSLLPGSYSFQLSMNPTSTATGTVIVIATSNVITVVPAQITAVIAGGSRFVEFNTTVVMQSASTDPNNYAHTYSWTVARASDEYQLPILSSTQSFTIPAGSMQAGEITMCV